MLSFKEYAIQSGIFAKFIRKRSKTKQARSNVPGVDQSDQRYQYMQAYDCQSVVLQEMDTSATSNK
jgi:hypothetical protein